LLAIRTRTGSEHPGERRATIASSSLLRQADRRPALRSSAPGTPSLCRSQLAGDQDWYRQRASGGTPGDDREQLASTTSGPPTSLAILSARNAFAL